MGNTQGLYNPLFEHDACGIGFVAHVEGRRSHRVLEMALEALRNHAHRGAVADDRKTGDGAGVLTQLPHELFARELQRMGLAQEVKRNVLAFTPGWHDRLRAMELHLDIRKRVVLERMLQKQAGLDRVVKDLTRGLLGR